MAYTIGKSQLIDYPPETLRSFHVYMYEWIDNLHFTRDPAEFVDDPARYLAVVRELFLEAGWDGDGEIRLMWLPPFVFSGNETPEFTRGVIAWHVKQTEDGLSWILSPVEFTFGDYRIDVP